MVESLADPREVVGSTILTMKTGRRKRERKEERGGGSWVSGPFLCQRAKLGLTRGQRAKGKGRRALMNFLSQTYE